MTPSRKRARGFVPWVIVGVALHASAASAQTAAPAERDDVITLRDGGLLRGAWPSCGGGTRCAWAHRRVGAHGTVDGHRDARGASFAGGATPTPAAGILVPGEGRVPSRVESPVVPREIGQAMPGLGVFVRGAWQRELPDDLRDAVHAAAPRRAAPAADARDGSGDAFHRGAAHRPGGRRAPCRSGGPKTSRRRRRTSPRSTGRARRPGASCAIARPGRRERALGRLRRARTGGVDADADARRSRWRAARCRSRSLTHCDEPCVYTALGVSALVLGVAALITGTALLSSPPDPPADVHPGGSAS